MKEEIKKRGERPGGRSLLEALREAGKEIAADCNGMGRCGSCRVRCVGEGIPGPVQGDRDHFTKAELDDGWRLACLLPEELSCSIELPGALQPQILTAGPQQIDRLTAGPRGVDIVSFTYTMPSEKDRRVATKRLFDAGGGRFKTISSACLCHLQEDLERCSGRAEAIVYGGEVLAIRACPADRAGIASPQDLVAGLAVDLGTTTIAGYLYDLETGRQLAVASCANAQRRFGADVISRVQYTMEKPDGLVVLQTAAIDGLTAVIREVCQIAGCQPDRIFEAVICGNTIMTHLLAGVSCVSIAVAPFIPTFTETRVLHPGELSPRLGLAGPLVLMPGIDSYVGSDITAGIISTIYTGPQRSVRLLMDLGTNGELALAVGDTILTCATAAGPVFEGASIKDGCLAVPGAIDGVDLSYEPPCTTIRGRTPVGICGSGILDAVAQLLQHGLIDDTGRMLEPEEVDDPSLTSRIHRYSDDHGGLSFELARDASGKVLGISSADVRQIQLAKAAIRAGIEILLKEADLAVADIEEVCLAGGFGNYLKVESAVALGLIPAELSDRTVAAGNTAAAGAVTWLLRPAKRAGFEKKLRSVRYIELSLHPDLEASFLEQMNFSV